MERLMGNRRLVRRIGIAAVVAALLGLVFYAGYWYSLDSVKVRYETAFAEHADIVRTVVRAGTVVPAGEQAVRAGTSGTVQSVLAKPGDVVGAGQALLVLDNPQAELGGRQASVAADLARLAFADVFDQAIATRVTTSAAGRISVLAARAGDAVSKGALAAIIYDPSRMAVTVQLPGYLRSGVTVGQRVTVTAGTLPGESFAGTITEIGGTLHGDANQTTVDLAVEFGAAGKVTPGSTVTVALVASAARRPCAGSVVLPVEGVFVAQDKAVVAAAVAGEGQRVKAGDLVMELANPALVAQRDQAKITYSQAATRYESIRYRYLEGEPILETIRLQMVQAEIAWRDLDARVKALTVVAPYAGRVVGVIGGAGTQVTPGDVVCQMVPDARFMVTATGSLSDLAWVEAGESVLVDVPAVDRAGLPGVVVNKTTPPGEQSSVTALLVLVDQPVQPWPGTAATVFLPAKEERLAVTGTCVAAEEYEIHFGAAGRVSGVDVSEGDVVEVGATLFSLRNEALLIGDAYPADVALPANPADLLPIAGPSLRQAILNLASGELAAEQRIAERNALTVRSPAPGTVTSILVEKGSSVAQGTVLAKVADPSALEVLADVDQADVNRLQLGAQIEVLFPALPNTTVMAELVSVEQSAQMAAGGPVYPIRLRLPPTPGLLSGMSCVVDMVTDVRPQVLTVPIEAVQDRYGAQAVRVVVDPSATGTGSLVRQSRTFKGEVEWVYVITGATDGIRVEILKGLQPGTEIVLREIER